MRPWLALALIFPLAAGGQALDPERHSGARAHGSETYPQFPQYPKPENYLPFDVSASTPFAFFVDAKSLSVGTDGEVRYSVIAKSTGGALNISFEGIRCADYEYRIYAIGKADNTWSKVRNSAWKAIRSDSRNAQQAVLYSEFFCPVSANITTAEEGLRALKRGGVIKGY